MKEPGGFRRHFLQTRADETGIPTWQRPKAWTSRVVDYAITMAQFEEYGGKHYPAIDASPRHVTSSNKVMVAILKSNVGPGALFLPQAVQNGGYAVSIFGIIFLGFLSAVCTLRLLEGRNRYGGKQTYGELLETVVGHRAGRYAVDISIILLQCGICTTYIIFIANVLHSGIFPNCSPTLWTFLCFVFAELLVIIPLAWVRQISRLAVTNIIADVLIVGSLIAILAYEAELLMYSPGSSGEAEIPRSNIVAVNSWNHILVFLGTACFVFEGIGLVIPTHDSMRDKEEFPRVFSFAITVVILIFLLCGLGGYFAFSGPDEPKSIILQDLPMTHAWNLARVAYAIAVVFTFPFQFLPAIRLMEYPIFGSPTTNPSMEHKIHKSVFRAGVVGCLALLAVAMRDNLAHFVSLIGAFCGVPLAFVYPIVVHYSMADSIWAKLVDTLLLIFGVSVMIFCSAINIYNIVNTAGK